MGTQAVQTEAQQRQRQALLRFRSLAQPSWPAELDRLGGIERVPGGDASVELAPLMGGRPRSRDADARSRSAVTMDADPMTSQERTNVLEIGWGPEL